MAYNKGEGERYGDEQGYDIDKGEGQEGGRTSIEEG